MKRAWLFLCLVSLLLAARPTETCGSDWPQFRGPGSTAISPDAEIPAQLKVAWSALLPGRGLASPIVVGDRIFVTAASGAHQERLHVLSFTAADGAKLWERQLRATGRTMSHPKTAVAAPTPCSDGHRVFAVWSSNDVAAFDLEGNLLWLRGLTSDYPNASNSLGMASSPIVIGETLVVMIENDSESYTLGLDVKTGRNLWKLERPKAANWTSPIPFRADAQSPAIALLQSAKGLLAVDPVSGSRLWEYVEGASTMSSSVAVGNVIYVPSNGITAIQPQASGAVPTQVWRAKGMNPSTISPLVVDGHLFSINGAGVITVADAATGANQWKLRLTGPFSGSPVGAANRLLAVNENGLLQTVEITATEGKVLGQFQLPLRREPAELILCTPALSGKSVYLRADSTLWRLEE